MQRHHFDKQNEYCYNYDIVGKKMENIGIYRKAPIANEYYTIVLNEYSICY